MSEFRGYPELPAQPGLPALEEEVLRFWRERNIFARSVSERAGGKVYAFYEGPPTANGRPGIHHVMSRTIKDLVCRYRTMRGMQVSRKAGWDTHGLPVEIEVEKALGFKRKDDIQAFGVAKFNEECRKSVWKYKADWERMTERMGYWVDMSAPYVTFENSYIESVWWSLKQFFDRGYIVKGYKIQPYCPRCETPLSSHELSLGYQEVSDPSVYVRARDSADPSLSYLVWTTTPWTLISNVALAVNPDARYVRVKAGDERLVLAEARLGSLEGEYEVEAAFPGSELVGKTYRRFFDYHPVEGAFRIIPADFVTMEDGSGIVHMAPAYGEDDYQAARAHGLPTIHPVDRSGRFSPEVTDFAGMFVKDADPEIIRNLKSRGILYKKATVRHSYPHCWRCSTPLLYYARDSWYITTTKFAGDMLKLNGEINWYPPEVGTGRFGNWLAENKDWALSRDRFWGTPLPVWVCAECGARKCVGSIEELRAGACPAGEIDLHKPWVDGVTFRCGCGATMNRTPELIDVWYDSGSMPFAQWHYPFENRELFERAHPADYICEGIDQTRGWFYSLHAISSALFGRPAYRNVIVNELVLDKNSQKMSKSKGNTVDPFTVLERYGADATRWYLVTTSPPWRPTPFDEEGIAEVQRKFFGTLLNSYAFFALYANIDGYDGSGAPVPHGQRPEIDRWILSRLNSLAEKFIAAMEAYDVTRAARMVSAFTIDELSNWYVRRNRRRFWKGEMGPDKRSAYQTLAECLATVARLAAPFAPFVADDIHRRLRRGADTPESVHLALIADPDPASIDRALEEKMAMALLIVGVVRSIRNRVNIKVRQPLRRLIIPDPSEEERRLIESVKPIVLEETNVKAIEYVGDDSVVMRKSVKPNFRTLGPKYGKSVQAVAAAIRALGPAEIRAAEKAGTVALPVDGGTVSVALEDIEIVREEIGSWAVGTEGAVTVALDTDLDERLVSEGLAREFVNRVQNIRKDSGFEVTDRIRIEFTGSERLTKALEEFADYIRGETLSGSLSVSRPAGRSAGQSDGTAPPSQGAGAPVTTEIDGEQCVIAVAKAGAASLQDA